MDIAAASDSFVLTPQQPIKAKFASISRFARDRSECTNVFEKSRPCSTHTVIKTAWCSVKVTFPQYSSEEMRKVDLPLLL